MRRGKHDGLVRWAAPAAVLAGVTVVAVLVQHALNNRSGTTATTQAVATATVAPRKHPRPRTFATRPAATGTGTTSTTGAGYYTVQAGDTFGAIAAREGTTVARLEQLNPGVSSSLLHVGQQIRVK